MKCFNYSILQWKNPFRIVLFLVILFSFSARCVMAQKPSTEASDSRIRINGLVFDPLTNPPRVDSATQRNNAKQDSIYQLIQFRRSLSREQMNLLKGQYGLNLTEYIPNSTYLEKVGKAQLRRIRTLSFFRWNGNYEPEYKISSAIGRSQFESPERRRERGLIVNVTCFKNVDVKGFSERLRVLRYSIVRVFDHSKIHSESRIRLRVISLAEVRRLAVLPEVKWIDEEGDITVDNGTEAGLIQSNTGAGTPIYNQGIRGEGQIVGVIDAILDLNSCFFNDPLVATAGPTHRKVVGYRQGSALTLSTGGTVGCSGTRANNGHGTHTSGTIAGFNAGNADNGIAFNARLTYGDLNDVTFSSGGGTVTFLNYLNEARDDGAFIHSNSWSDKATGVIGNYTGLSRDLDEFTWNNEDQLVVVSSGNNIDTNSDGVPDTPSPTRPPFTSKNGLSVGASSAANTANISTGAVGPTADGRRKPEIYAPGSNTTSALGGSTCATLVCRGSSMATPMIAGAAALVRQYYTEGFYPSGTRRPDQGFTPTGALLKATLLNSTRDINGTDAFGVAAPVNGYPTNLEGWGELVLDDALFFQGDARNLMAWDVRHASGLNTGEQDVYSLNVTSSAQPLKITLAWMEPPAATSSFGAPVTNDLNLRVIAPNGTTIFRGNNFAGGQSAAGDATVDGLNNVEMVLVNNPAAGVWRIEVIGTTVNQGNPSQGYALVATGDLVDLPVPTGVQNTLVVLTSLPGTIPIGAPAQTTATNLMNNLNAYITEASYGVTTINPVFANVTLTTPLGNYLATNQNPLIEMTQDVVNQLVANPNTFTRGTPSTADDISRIVILLNDRNFTGDWATTGGWPYDVPAGLPGRLSVSVSSIFNDPDQRIAHAMCHQLGLMDLYAHPGVTFAQPHVDNWDIMANLNRVQPMAWAKEKALWLSTHDANSILWIPRPGAGVTFDQSVAMNFLSSTNTSNKRAIALGLTPNTTLATENVFFFIEARSNGGTNADSGLPGSGVLLYYVNENIRQGEGPARIIDRVVGGTLDDAQLDAVGQIHDLMGSYGLRVTRQSTTGTEDARVRVEYDPIETQNDVNISAGDPYWQSPDIWIDNPENGYDAVPGDNGEHPVSGGVNRIYFTIRNAGPGPAFDITVSVRLSEPHHTVGGEDDFNRFLTQKFYPTLASGGIITDFVEWTPVAGADPHNCIKVTIEDVVNDINTFNNSAQQNVDVVQSRTSSPYETVTFNFSATNPYDYYQLIYFRTEGVPAGWTATFAESKRLLAAHERYEGTLTVQPPDDAPVCTDHTIYVTSWLPKGNTLIQLGGATLQVNLRNRTTLTADVTSIPCQSARQLAVAKYSPAKCYTLTTTGCTNPVRPNEDIIIRYEDPEGNPVYHTVRTDSNGCYSDTYVVADGGEWKVTAKYPGSECAGGTTTTGVSVVVPLAPGRGGNGNCGKDGGGDLFVPYLKNVWFSAHVGSSHPLGNLTKTSDANIYAMLDLSFPVRSNMNLQLMYGIAQFTNKNTVLAPNQRWSHISINAQRIFARSYDMKPYVRAGLGSYMSSASSTTLGANIGVGGMTKVTNQLILTPGVDVHVPSFSSKDEKPSFLVFHLGILFR